jgi:N-acetylglucosamine-6-phosphate deacetylase
VEAPGLLAAAFVDVHCHGYGGVSFADCDADGLRRAREGLHAQGVGGFLASLGSLPPEVLTRQLDTLAPLVGRVEAGRATLLGMHLEGPYLSMERRGAHPPAFLRTPDAAEMATWLRRAQGTVRQVTLAPELPGARAVARSVDDAGSVVALGHSAATMAEALEAMARGARHVTHLWNGMSGIAHRGAGLVAAALAARGVSVELIADGIHVEPAIVDITYRMVGPERMCLVTDSMPATGVGDGVYESPGRRVRVVDGVARTETGVLAGSTLTMAKAVENLVAWGVAPVATAAHMASRVPAAAIGLGPWGALSAGAPAHLVALSPDGRHLPWQERARLEAGTGR